MVKLWKGGEPELLKTIFGTAVLAMRVPLHGLLRNWRTKECESLQVPVPTSWTIPGIGTSARAGFAERPEEATLEDCLYGSGEPAAD
jgi:hypothetical protein